MLGTSKQNPVVGPLSLESTVAFAQQLHAGMVDWTSGKEWGTQSCSMSGGNTHLGQWHSKFKDGHWIANLIEDRAKDSDREGARVKGFVYLFNGKPIGVMTATDHQDHVYIHELVASPATNGAGCALIEAAVRWSERSGCFGTVHLRPHNKAVYDVYTRYGFQKFDWRLKLEPLTSDAWEKTIDGWSIKAKIGRAYAVSGLEQ